MIRGIGVDVSALNRWEDAGTRDKLLRYAFCPDEIAYVTARGKGAAQSAAGLFCAKEAFVKALGTGLRGLAMRDIVIGHTPAGQPFYRLEGPLFEAMAAAGANRADLSITHDGGMAAAFCVLSFEEENNAPLPVREGNARNRKGGL